MITRVLVENYKSLRLLDLELGRFALVVGPNGSGKTSLLRALALTHELGQQREPQLPASALSQGASSGVVLQVENECASRTWIVEPGAQPECIERGTEQDLLELDAIRLYELDSGILARPCWVGLPDSSLGSRGEACAAALERLQSEGGDRFEALQRVMRELVPGLRKVAAVRREARTGAGQSISACCVSFDFDHAQGVDALDAGEGSVCLLGQLSALALHREPGTLMLDGFARGLDEVRARRLLAHLQTELEARPGLQLLLSTRSEALAAALPAEARIELRPPP